MKAASLLRAGTLLAALCGLSACFDGSETGNPAKGTAGVVKTLDGLPAARVRMTLVPRDFNPLDQIAHKSVPVSVITDGQGRFRFTGIDSGIYNLEAADPASGARAFVKGIVISDGVVELPEQTLKSPGRIDASLEGADGGKGYIYVTGTTLYGKVSGAGEASLDRVAAGFIDSLQYGSPDGSIPAKAFAWDLRVRPEDASPAAGPYLAWKRSAVLTVNTTETGAGVPGTVSRIPLLVRLDKTRFDFSAAASGGADLRFTDGHGAPLACEIQRWDSAAGTAEAWVLADSVFGDSIQKLHMHWGREGAAALPTGSVFAPADGYAGAWHLDEDASGTAPQFKDASGAGNPATAIGSPAASPADGIASGAMALDGASQFAGTRKAFADPQVFTVSAWFRAGASAGGKLIDFTDADTSTAMFYRDRHVFMTGDGILHFGVYPPVVPGQSDPNPGLYQTVGAPKPSNDGLWHHVAARLSPAGQDLFVDGVRVASDPASTEAEHITGHWRWGYGTLDKWAPAGTNPYLKGVLDEIRIAHAARSDAYIKLDYENQKSDSRLISFP